MPRLTTLITAAVLVVSAPLGFAQDTSSPVLGDLDRETLRAEIRAYLLDEPEILMEVFALLEERQKAEETENDLKLVADNAAEIFEDGFSFIGGNPDGDFTIVEFLDYQCTYCRRAHPQISTLIAEDSNIRLIVKELPILGPDSELAARAAVATLINVGEEAYVTLNDLMMSSQGPVNDGNLDDVLREAGVEPSEIREKMQDPEVTERLVRTRSLAEKLGVTGTPTFIFDTQLVRGYLPLEQMTSLIEDIRVTN